jgi:2-polyprenyl-6-methoxyphenol hydroxylase-like FAD-dependent oxidoreductase
LAEMIAEVEVLTSPLLFKHYLEKRKKDQQSNENFTHELIKLFESKNPFLKCFRGIGLGIFDLMPSMVKRTFCLRRMGVA